MISVKEFILKLHGFQKNKKSDGYKQIFLFLYWRHAISSKCLKILIFCADQKPSWRTPNTRFPSQHPAPDVSVSSAQSYLSQNVGVLWSGESERSCCAETAAHRHTVRAPKPNRSGAVVSQCRDVSIRDFDVLCEKAA